MRHFLLHSNEPKTILNSKMTVEKALSRKLNRRLHGGKEKEGNGFSNGFKIKRACDLQGKHVKSPVAPLALQRYCRWIDGDRSPASSLAAGEQEM